MAAQRDYHDWIILQLEQAAEQSLRSAVLLASKHDECEASIGAQRCTTILENIRRLKASVSYAEIVGR